VRKMKVSLSNPMYLIQNPSYLNQD